MITSQSAHLLCLADATVPAFRSFVRLTADLGATLRRRRARLDRLDTSIDDLSGEGRDEVRRLVAEAEAPELFTYLDGRFRELQDAQEGLAEAEQDLLRDYFRAELQDLIVTGELFACDEARPHGHSSIRSWIYEPRFRGARVFEMLMHEYVAQCAAGQRAAGFEEIASQMFLWLIEPEIEEPETQVLRRAA